MPGRQVAGGLLVAALVSAVIWAWVSLGAPPARASVPVAHPTRGEFVVSLHSEGLLASDDAVSVRNGDARGKIMGIVADGATIRAGEPFCRVEVQEMEQRLIQVELRAKQAKEEIERTRESAQQEYETARRAVEQAKQDMALFEQSSQVGVRQAEEQLKYDRAEESRLQLELDRKRRLLAKGCVPGTEVEIAQAAYEAQSFKVAQSVKDLALKRQELASQLRQKKTAVEAAENKSGVTQARIEEQVSYAKQRAETAAKEMEEMRASIAAATVRAPVSGVVTLTTNWAGGERRVLKEGDQVWWGVTLGTISNLARMSVRARIKEADICSVWKGQPAEVLFEVLPGQVFTGSVRSISTVAREVSPEEDPNAQPNERVFDVWVSVVQKHPGRLKPGLNAKVELFVKRIPKALFVPLEAVFEREGKSLVYVQQGERFVPRRVKVGERNDVAVVTLAGLNGREVVAMSDPTRLPVQKAKQ